MSVLEAGGGRAVSSPAGQVPGASELSRGDVQMKRSKRREVKPTDVNSKSFCMKVNRGCNQASA